MHTEFGPEFGALPDEVRQSVYAAAEKLARDGPLLNRPAVDTLKGSEHANMKELRFEANDGAWRVAFAFDTKRRAVLLVAGDKSGVSQKAFYERLIAKADKRFTSHLAAVKAEEDKKKKSAKKEKNK